MREGKVCCQTSVIFISCQETESYTQLLCQKEKKGTNEKSEEENGTTTLRGDDDDDDKENITIDQSHALEVLFV